MANEDALKAAIAGLQDAGSRQSAVIATMRYGESYPVPTSDLLARLAQSQIDMAAAVDAVMSVVPAPAP